MGNKTTAKNRRWALRKRYGITPEDFDRMVEAQGGVCALCAGHPDRSMNGAEPKLVVDHNHDTGKARGLLCFTCNVRLSAIEDEQFMLLARLYLRRHDGAEFVNDLGPHPYLEGALDL